MTSVHRVQHLIHLLSTGAVVILEFTFDSETVIFWRAWMFSMIRNAGTRDVGVAKGTLPKRV